MSSFAEFLGRRSWTSRKRDIVLVKDLGEWAWEQILKEITYPTKFLTEKERARMALGKIKKDNFPGYWICLQIAVACLGEKEVRKRLKAVQKK